MELWNSNLFIYKQIKNNHMLNKEKVETIKNLYLNGIKVKRKQKIFKDNIIGLRKSNIPYNLDSGELIEYSKCYNDIYYFIEKYLNIKLYPYQKKIIKHYEENRFSIYMNSIQMGLNRILACVFLHEIIFNVDTSILLVYNKTTELEEHNNIFKSLYLKLPFYLQSGTNIWNHNNIKLDNGCSISFRTKSKYASIGHDYNTIMLLDFSKYYPNVANKIMADVVPIQMSRKNTKLIIQSQPNGYNHFIKLVENSERKELDPSKNIFNTLRTYWWEHPNRKETWKENQIKIVGEDFFSKNFEFKFNI